MAFEWGKDSTPVAASGFQWGKDSTPAPDVSSLEAAGRGAAQGATLGFGDEIQGGIQAVARKWIGDEKRPLVDLYREERDAARRDNAAAEDAHPIAYGAGNVAGGLVTAPLMPAVDSVGAAAVAGGALGGASGLGGSNADLTKGDVAGAAKDTGLGVGLGLVAGAAGQKLAGSIPGAAKGAADELKDLAERKAVNAIRPTAGEVRQLSQQGKLGELGDWLLRNKVVEAGDTFQDIATKAEGIKAGAGKALEAALQDLDSTGQTIPKAKLAQAFSDLADEARARGPGAEPLVQKYLAAAEDVMKRPEQELTFSQAEAWKRGFQDRVNYARLNPTAAQMGDKELASAARGVVEDSASAVPGSDVFTQAKSAYGSAAKVSDMAEGALGRQEARNIASPSDKITAGGAVLAGILTGHPVAGVAAAGIAGVANKVVRDRAASTIAVGAKNLSEKIAGLAASDPQALGHYGAVLAGALQRGGQNEYAAHYYVLSQTDPAFNDLTRKIADGR